MPYRTKVRDFLSLILELKVLQYHMGPCFNLIVEFGKFTISDEVIELEHYSMSFGVDSLPIDVLPLICPVFKQQQRSWLNRDHLCHEPILTLSYKQLLLDEC
jgi:hypothetical protein